MSELASPQIIVAFLAACHDIGQRKLAECSSGNLSLRLDHQRMLITASGSWMSRITGDELSVCRIGDGQLIEGKKASVEARFHGGILEKRPEMNAVLHFQSPNATVLTCMDPAAVNYNVLPEIPFYIGPIGHVDYLTPGSEELAAAVIEVMKTHDMAVLQNHGLVTAAKDMNTAIQNAVFFELACSVIVNGGEKVIPLLAEQVEKHTRLGRQARVK